MRAGPNVDMKVINVGKKHNTTPGTLGDTPQTPRSQPWTLASWELVANGKMLEASPDEGRQHN